MAIDRHENLLASGAFVNRICHKSLNANVHGIRDALGPLNILNSYRGFFMFAVFYISSILYISSKIVFAMDNLPGPRRRQQETSNPPMAHEFSHLNPRLARLTRSRKSRARRHVRTPDENKVSHANTRLAKLTKLRMTCARRHVCIFGDHKLSNTSTRIANITRARTICARRLVRTFENHK